MSRLLLNRSPLVQKLQTCVVATIYPNSSTSRRTHSQFSKRNDYNKNNQLNINQIRWGSNSVTSPLGNVKLSNENMVEHVWRNYEERIDKPAAVSRFNCSIKPF